MISVTEKDFIIKGIEDNIRIDGRPLFNYRHLNYEKNEFSNIISLGNTRVEVKIKPEIVELPGISIFISSVGNLKHGKISGEKDPYTYVCKVLERMLSTREILSQLEIASNSFKNISWKLNFDISLHNDDGNIMDAISFGTWISLKNLKIPKVLVEQVDFSFDYQVGDEQDMFSLDISTVPILISVCVIGDRILADCSRTEEFCCDSVVRVGIKNDGIDKSIVFLHKEGNRGVSDDLIVEITRKAVDFISIPIFEMLIKSFNH